MRRVEHPYIGRTDYGCSVVQVVPNTYGVLILGRLITGKFLLEWIQAKTDSLQDLASDASTSRPTYT